MQWNRRGWGTRGRSLARLLRFRRAYRGALVVTLHDVFDRHGLRQRWLEPEVWGLRWLGRTADRLVVHSQVEVERLRGLVPLERLRVVPHFVERRTLPLSAVEARARLGLADRRIVTLLGFVYGRKGHRYAVEAVPYLPDDVVMVYAGGPVAGRSYVHDLAMQKAAELAAGRPLPDHRLPLRGGARDVDRGDPPRHPALHRPVGVGVAVDLDRGRQADARERPARLS